MQKPEFSYYETVAWPHDGPTNSYEAVGVHWVRGFEGPKVPLCSENPRFDWVPLSYPNSF